MGIKITNDFQLNEVELWGSGSPRREFLHVSKIENLSWRFTIALKDDLKEAYEWFTTNNRVVGGLIKWQKYSIW